MKGVIFTEFFRLVEQTFGEDMVDDLIEETQPASGGSYTAVGTYPHEELVAMVLALAAKSGMSVPDLLKAYGEFLFSRFAILYPHFFVGYSDPLVFLESVEPIIHSEVLKLHPDAALPKFDTTRRGEHTVVMRYSSPRHLEDVAHGLINGCASHFGEAVSVVKEPVSEDSQQIQFVISRLLDGKS